MSKFYLRKVPINSGGYDPGGAYWGIGTPLWYYEASGDRSPANLDKQPDPGWCGDPKRGASMGRRSFADYGEECAGFLRAVTRKEAKAEVAKIALENGFVAEFYR